LERLGSVGRHALTRLVAGCPKPRVPVTWHSDPAAPHSVEVLEHIGDGPARRLLAALAKGTPESRLTREARESLGRLDRTVKNQ